MGSWGSRPWDNDTAADWFGDLFDEVPLRERVMTSVVQRDCNDTSRAAISVLLFLCRTYVWPVDHLDEDLAEAVRRLEEVEEDDLLPAETRREIGLELAVLRARQTDEASSNEETSVWWNSLR